jgi:CheY-like chemotaxis protein
MNAVIADIEKMLTRLIGEDIRLITKPAPRLQSVLADAGQLHQVLMNLAVNARDAMPNGGTLSIETANVRFDEAYCAAHEDAQPGPHVMIAVSDTGTGMTPEVREQIFEPFFTTKPRGSGTGLGLATVYGIVKQSNGWIWVYTEPGLGTTFKIYLPSVEVAPTKTSSPNLKNVRGDETLLVVEDQAKVRAFVLAALQTYGYKALGAGTASEALAAVRTFPEQLDLVVTDVVHPDITGRELADRITSLRPGIPIVFMSGYTDEIILQRGILPPEVDYMQKPFTPDALAAKIREVLDRKTSAV